MVECLRVNPVRHPMKRLGNESGDGGYVIVSVGTYDLFLSAGIGEDNSFEQAFAVEHAGVHGTCFDGSITAMPGSLYSLVRKNIGRGEGKEHLSSYFGQAENVFLKMDIEGHEFEVLADLLEHDVMRRVKQMVLEVHHAKLEVLEQLAATHRLCHLHPNNAGNMELVGGAWIPEYFECTYLRIAEFDLGTAVPTCGTELDMPNCFFRPELVFTNELDPMCELLAGAIRLEDAGDPEAALSIYEGMMITRPGDPAAATNAGIIYAQLGRRDEAIRCLKAAVSSGNAPKNTAAALCGLLLEKTFDLIEAHDQAGALETAESALRISAECESAWVALALSAIVNKLAYKYLPYVRAVHSGNPGWGVLHKAFFLMLADTHNYAEVLELAKTIKEWDGPSLSAHMITMMHFGMGVATLNAASRIPTEIRRSNELLNLEAGAHVELGETDLAMCTYAEAKPGSRINPNALLTSNSSCKMSDEEVFALHLAWADPMNGMEIPRSELVTHSGKRLRVGYIGSDFNEHAVCHFVFGLLTKYNKEAFEVYVYDSQQQEQRHSKAGTLVAASVDSYVNISTMPDEEAARRILKDGLDILVDLASHTAGTRMGVVARKPARTLACMIGYPNTTGLCCMNWRLADAITDPLDGFYTEKLVKVSGCMLCYRPTFSEGDRLPEIVEGGRGTRFGCFAKLCKISNTVWSLWKEIMDRVPGATITLKAKVFKDMDSVSRFLSRISSLGFDVKRLRLLPYTGSHSEHLNAYNGVDVSLDTFPYSGTTVTCDSLLMGVPVVTLRGSSHRHNVTASILINAGFPENVCSTRAEYVDRACSLATAAARGNKQTLRTKFLASPLCDEKSYVSKIETQFFNAIAK